MAAKQPKTIFSPKQEEAEKELLNSTNAVSLIKEAIVKALYNNIPKAEVERIIKDIIRRAIRGRGRIDARVLMETLQMMAKRDEYTLRGNMRVINEGFRNRAANLGFTVSFTADGIDRRSEIMTETKFRGFWTDAQRGLPLIKDYQKRVREQLKALSADPPKTARIDRNGNAFTIPLRNYAEMRARFEANQEDIAKLRDEGVDLVWISSHVDASVRCAPYQGKLYSLTGENVGKVIDGNKVEDFNEATLGPKGDGNGIINGFNCRHYLIEYFAGSRPPTDFNKAEIKKERDINTRQRQYENNIRQIKMEQRLSQAAGDPQRAKALSNRWHKLERNYIRYSIDNGRPYYLWRTFIMQEEINE